MQKIIPIVACVLLIVGIWLIFHTNADTITPNDIPTAQPKPTEPEVQPGSEQGATPPAPPVPVDDSANSAKVSATDQPCTNNTCQKKAEATASKKQYTPVPWVAVPGLPEPEPPQSVQAAEPNTETVIVRGSRRRLLRRN